jgi:hypothetical protein
MNRPLSIFRDVYMPVTIVRSREQPNHKIKVHICHQAASFHFVLYILPQKQIETLNKSLLLFNCYFFPNDYGAYTIAEENRRLLIEDEEGLGDNEIAEAAVAFTTEDCALLCKIAKENYGEEDFPSRESEYTKKLYEKLLPDTNPHTTFTKTELIELQNMIEGYDENAEERKQTESMMDKIIAAK